MKISARETNCSMQWIVIYPVDKVIHLFNNWSQYGTTKAMSTLISVLFELTDIFFRFVLASTRMYSVKTVTEIASSQIKTFSRVEIFEKASFSFTCGRTKAEVF